MLPGVILQRQEQDVANPEREVHEIVTVDDRHTDTQFCRARRRLTTRMRCVTPGSDNVQGLMLPGAYLATPGTAGSGP